MAHITKRENELIEELNSGVYTKEEVQDWIDKLLEEEKDLNKVLIGRQGELVREFSEVEGDLNMEQDIIDELTEREGKLIDSLYMINMKVVNLVKYRDTK